MSRVSPAPDRPVVSFSADVKKMISQNSGLAEVKELIRANSGQSSPKVSPSGLATSISLSSRNGNIFKPPGGTKTLLALPSPCNAVCGTPSAAPSVTPKSVATTRICIIDEATENFKEFQEKSRFKAVVDSWVFGLFISLVILANAVQMGFEVDDRNMQFNWASFEIAFLVIYLVEVVLRYLAHGRASFQDRWFCLDVVICLIALFDTVRNLSRSGERDTGNTVVMLRILRGMKIMRLVRLFRFFPELYLLVSSLGSAMKTVMWMWMLLGLVIWTFSLFFVSEVGREYPDDQLIQLWFGTVVQGCFTLFTIVTLEGWVEVARHMWDDSPFIVVVVIFFMTITTYMIMNILVGVVVQHVIDKALASQEQELTQMEMELEHKTITLLKIFQAADCDGDAKLSKAEFLQMASNQKLEHIFQVLDLKQGDIELLFDEMDVNRDGTLEVQEFVSAIMQMRGGARAKRVFELHNDVTRLSSAFAHHAQKTEDALDLIKGLEVKTDTALQSQSESIRRIEHALEALTLRFCGSTEIPAAEPQRSLIYKCPDPPPAEQVVSQQNGSEENHQGLRGTAEAPAADMPAVPG